jgi:hypothetical protein
MTRMRRVIAEIVFARSGRGQYFRSGLFLLCLEKAVSYTPRAAIGGARFITDAITQTDRD